jgi:hypothetical protein
MSNFFCWIVPFVVFPRAYSFPFLVLGMILMFKNRRNQNIEKLAITPQHNGMENREITGDYQQRMWEYYLINIP